MKVNFVTLLLCFQSFLSYAQVDIELFGTVKAGEKISLNLKDGAIKEGSEIKLKKVEWYGAASDIIIEYNGSEYTIFNEDLSKIDLKCPDLKSFWQQKALKNFVYSNIAKNGMQYDIRNELEDDALNFISTLESNHLLLDDSYIEDFLYSIVIKLSPGQLFDGRPGIINVKILKDSLPNALWGPMELW